jgi:uncharacterized cupredoxin-like copper-binding protein
MRARIVLALSTVLLAPGAVGGASTHPERLPSTVGIWLKEWKVIPSARVVRAGKVTFVVSNIGKIEHELVVIRTNRAPNALRVKAGEASEAGSRGEVESLRPPLADHMTVTLQPGRYVLICNLHDHGGHYKHGMFTSLTVR